MKSTIHLIAVTISLTLVGCGDDTATTDSTPPSDQAQANTDETVTDDAAKVKKQIRQEVKEIVQDLRDAKDAAADFAARRVAIDELKDRVDELDEKIESLKEKATGVSEDAKADWNRNMEALTEKRQKLQQSIDKLSEETEAAWDELLNGFESAWDELQQAFDDAASQFENGASSETNLPE